MQLNNHRPLLMYENFYNLKTEPFRLTPDHKFCYNHSSYAKAKAYMQYAFERAEGFVMITGKAGTGKTTLVNDLIDSLPKSKVKVAMLVSTQLEADDILRMSAFSFGLDTSATNKSTILQDLSKLLISNHRKGQRALLIVDEAQDLSVSSLEELRLLTNFQLHNHQLVQIFLLGQEGLGELIQKPEMEQVHQRLIAVHHLETLSEEETKAYIRHRLTKAGWQGDPAISNAVYSIVFEASAGTPRRINSICSRLLLHGSVEQRHHLGILDVKIVLEELEQEGLAGEIRSTGINFNKTDQYDVEDSFVEGPDAEEKKSIYSLEPCDNENTEDNAPDASDASERIEKNLTSSVKDTWIDKAPEPKMQRPPPNDDFIDTLTKQDSLTDSNNPDASGQFESDSYILNHGDKSVTKNLPPRRFRIYTYLGILSLITGLALLLILVWQPDLGSYFRSTNHDKTAEINPKSLLNQKLETPVVKAETSEKQTQSANAPDTLTYPPVVRSRAVNSGQTEPAAPEPASVTPIESNAIVTSVNNTTEQNGIDTVNISAPTPDAIISFEFNKFYISSKFQRELDAISNKMDSPDKMKALIIGYSDSTGGTEYNLNLSSQRAIAVAAYLARRGVENDRMTTVGKGHPSNTPTEETAEPDVEATDQRIVKIFLSPEMD